jgi:hypothetical protein
VPGRAYYFVCARGQEKRAPIKEFRDWVFAEIEETHASLGAALSRLGADTGSEPQAQALTPLARAVYREAPRQSRKPAKASRKRTTAKDRT